MTAADPDEDTLRVLDAITRRSLARRGETALLARLDEPDARVLVDVDGNDDVRVHLDGVLVNVVPSADLSRAMAMARAGRPRPS